MQLHCWSVATLGQGARKETDVGLLVIIDLLKVAVEGIGEPGRHKLSLSVILESFLIEFALQIFEGEGVVELLSRLDMSGVRSPMALRTIMSSVTFGVDTRFSTTIGDAIVKLAAKNTARVVGRSIVVIEINTEDFKMLFVDLVLGFKVKMN